MHANVQDPNRKKYKNKQQHVNKSKQHNQTFIYCGCFFNMNLWVVHKYIFKKQPQEIMSTFTNLNNDIMAKLFRAFHNPTKFQDWWFLLHPNDETYLSNNNKIISSNKLFDISNSERGKI